MAGLPSMDEIRDLALKYSSKQLGELVAMGQLDQQKALLAGQMRKRIAQQELEPPKTTVAQDTLQPQPQPQMAGLGAAAGQPMPPRPPQGGVNQVPVPPQMFKAAQGGIVGYAIGGRVDPRVSALMQRYPSLTMAQATKLITGGLGAGTFTAGLAATDALMATDKGGITNIPPTPGYDYGAETMAGGRPEIPTGTTGARGEPGFMDYLVDKITPRAYKQVMDPKTGKFVDMPPVPAPTSASPGLAGVLDQQKVQEENAPERALREELETQGPTGVPMLPKEEEELAKQREKIEDAGEKEPERRGGKSTIDLALDTLNAKPKDESVTDLSGIDQLKAINEAFGVNADFFKEQAASLKEQAENLKKDKKEAANLRLLEAGLRIMGGESPYAMVNIGKGASEAMQGYAKDIIEIKRAQREFDKATRDLALAQQQQARADSRVSFKELNDMARHQDNKATQLAIAKSNILVEYDKMKAAQKRTETMGSYQVQAAKAMRPATEATVRNNASQATEARLLLDPKFREAKNRKDQAGMLQRRNEIFAEELSKLAPSGDVNLNTQALGNIIDFQTALGNR